MPCKFKRLRICYVFVVAVIDKKPGFSGTTHPRTREAW